MYMDYSQVSVEFRGFNCANLFVVGVSLALLFSKNILKAQLLEPQLPPPISSRVRTFKLVYRYPKLSHSTIRKPHSKFHIGKNIVNISITCQHKSCVFLEVVWLRSPKFSGWSSCRTLPGTHCASAQSSFLVSRCHVTFSPPCSIRHFRRTGRHQDNSYVLHRYIQRRV